MAAVQVLLYLDVISSWCHWVEPAWDDVKARFAHDDVEFGWRIALMNPEDVPVSRSQCDWFYRRSGGTVMHSPSMLRSDWLEPERRGDYRAPNLVPEAGRDFGIEDDRLWRAIAHAAKLEGKKIGDIAIAAEVGAPIAGVPAARLRERAESAEVRARVEASTAEFHAHRITQRPAFILQDEIGDKAVFSGLVTAAPLVATIAAMLADTRAYAAHRVHFGDVPAS